MEMRRAEVHVAQQSRRDKLRIQYQQQSSTLLNHYDHIHVHGNARNGDHGGGLLLYDDYDPTNATTVVSPQPEGGGEEEEILNFSSAANNNSEPLLRWKFVGSSSPQQICYPASSIPFLGTTYPAPTDGYDHHHRQNQQRLVVEPSLMNIDHPDLTQQQLYQNNSSNQGCDVDDDELVLLPQSSTYNGNNNAAAANWMDHHHHQLALSLSSNHPWESSSREIHGLVPYHHQLVNNNSVVSLLHHHQDSKPPLAKMSTPSPNPLLLPHQDVGVVGTPPAPSNNIISSSSRNTTTGPLGPFTGYATILKSSRFLKPAQSLLHEFCALIASTPHHKLLSKTSSGHRHDDDDILERNCSRDHEISGAAAEVVVSPGKTSREEVIAGNKTGDSNGGVSSSSLSSATFYGSNKTCGEAAEVGGSSAESCQQKKATLLFMHEEVCRRYGQYHQQMQMVVSSFESVAGLSAAAPYISLALKMITRSFRSLKNAISNQLRHVGKALGEDLSTPSTGLGSTKGDTTMSSLKILEQSFRKHKPGGVDAGFLEPQQHVWRPQRGLPERSVTILRAWLFDHFLHPYPTDTDKHMLATQTGLSRNQVSNWFINARVRVWKPMVEEIHMLETKASPEAGLNPGKNDGAFLPKHVGGHQSNHDESSNSRLSVDVMPDKRVESCGMGTTSEGVVDNLPNNVDQQYWNHEKRARVECHQISTSMGGAMIRFGPYNNGGLENVGGLGAVSLTLGLRNNVESSQQSQQHEHHHRLRQHFGGHMIHDFVG